MRAQSNFGTDTAEAAHLPPLGSTPPTTRYSYPFSVGRKLEFTTAETCAVVVASSRRCPARVRALCEKVLAPRYVAGGPMKLLECFLQGQTSGTCDGADFSDAADETGSPAGTVELAPDDDAV